MIGRMQKCTASLRDFASNTPQSSKRRDLPSIVSAMNSRGNHGCFFSRYAEQPDAFSSLRAQISRTCCSHARSFAGVSFSSAPRSVPVVSDSFANQ